MTLAVPENPTMAGMHKEGCFLSLVPFLLSLVPFSPSWPSRPHPLYCWTAPLLPMHLSSQRKLVRHGPKLRAASKLSISSQQLDSNFAAGTSPISLLSSLRLFLRLSYSQCAWQDGMIRGGREPIGKRPPL